MNHYIAACPCAGNVLSTVLIFLGIGSIYVTAVKKFLSFGRECVAEVIGTFILVFFGIGSMHVSVLTGASTVLWQIAVAWGVGIALAIYAVSAVSGCHINPAITVSFAVFRKFPLWKVPWYLISQLVGAMLAAATLYFVFADIIHNFEVVSCVIRGAPGSEISAMIYAEYFPNPAIAKAMSWDANVINRFQAMAGEAAGTALLAFFIFCMTDVRNHGGPGGRLMPLFIGLAVSIIIAIITPITQAGLNPARDFGPRLFAWFAGWKEIAIPGPRGGWFTVYILSPIIGSLVGATIYEYLIRPNIRTVDIPADNQFDEGSVRSCNCCCQDSPTMRVIPPTERKAPIRLIMVGGFLGAGKTTLLFKVAQSLAARGKRIGLITNDQAPDLVDTALLARTGIGVQEVAGSCFCCNFPALIGASQKLIENMKAEIIIAEPVGSCTDLSATIIQPLKDKFARQFILSPLTVLADPARVMEILTQKLQGNLHESAAYIYRKQLEEADLILLNKTDLLSNKQQKEIITLINNEFPGTTVMCISALNGKGVEDWIETVLTNMSTGMNIAKVDYDIYAEGEALLGWLNSVVQLSSESADWNSICTDLLTKLQVVCQKKNVEIGHIKVFLSSSNDFIVANLTSTSGNISMRGNVSGMPTEAQLIINARVQMPPDELEKIVRQVLSDIAGSATKINIRHLQSLSPGRPCPTYRYDEVA